MEQLDFSKISMTGRFCYVFMCIEKYLTEKWPDRDWTIIAEHMWQWTKQYWDESWDIYSVIVPEYIMQHDSYEVTRDVDFDGELDQDVYNRLIDLYSDITDGQGTCDFDILMKIPCDMGNICDGAAFSSAERLVQEEMDIVFELLDRADVALPAIEKVNDFDVSIGNGWGGFMDTTYLSIILGGRK